MKKRGKLSEVEKYYIVNHKDLPISDLAEQLNRSEAAVQKVLGSDANVGETDVETDQPIDGGPKAGELMGHHREATIMTPAASERADENRPKGRRFPERMKSAIHKPKG